MDSRFCRGVLSVLAGSAAVLATALVPVAGARSARMTTGGSVHPIRSCATLAEVTWPDGSRVTSAADVPATPETPEFCDVTVLVPDRINIEIALPTTNWNGRYQAFGGGGWAGGFGIGNAGFPAALTQGYVVSVTDTGHEGTFYDAEWAWSPTGMNYNLIQDFFYRSNHEMALRSKDLTALFYGTRPGYSYWNGCSSGGREGLTEAMRYPDDFNGIVAGSPAINWTRFIPAMSWDQFVMNWLGDYLPTCKQDAVMNAVMAACDGSADGPKDGLIDPLACNFDPNKLLGLSTPCGTITAKDVAVVEAFWEGPRDKAGKFLWYGYPSFNVSAYPAQTLSVPSDSDPTGVAASGIPEVISDDWYRYFIHQDPAWNWAEETYDQSVADFQTSVSEWADDASTDDPNLSAFKAHGGKLIITHGLADPAIMPQGSINYYDNVLQTMGGLSNVSSFARLFLIPNAGHCAAGTGSTYPTDPFGTVVNWVEHGVAPATLASSGTSVSGDPIARNLCPYPQRMAYNGSGDALKASSFHCTGPSLSSSVGSANAPLRIRDTAFEPASTPAPSFGNPPLAPLANAP